MPGNEAGDLRVGQAGDLDEVAPEHAFIGSAQLGIAKMAQLPGNEVIRRFAGRPLEGDTLTAVKGRANLSEGL